MVGSIVACGTDPDDTKESESDSSVASDTPGTVAPETDAPESESKETEGDESMALTESGIILTDKFSFVERDDDSKVRKEATITRISQIDQKNVEKIGDCYYVSASAPEFELFGATIDAKGKIVRSGAESLGGDYAEDNAGVTLRFVTSATTIKIKASVIGQYTKNTVVPRGSYGFDVYTGSGTKRIEAGTHLQKMTETSIDEAVNLPGGIKEVVIYLPQLATVKNLKIGFDSVNARIGLPLARDYAPIVVYGSEITQGAGSSRPGNAYGNIVARMLNTDCINLGTIDGAHGDKKTAEYIASLEEISALVMEFDHGATLDELKANHYNFYKTVRDAHPDIPIIIMNDPVFSEADKAERGERVAVIAETYNKALKAGDANVWLLDGEDIFPTDYLLDIYTTEYNNLNNTGLYYLSTCIYDILNSAFTPDEGKSGVKREVGFKDPFEVELFNNNDKIEGAEYVKVSELDSKYVNTKKNGYNFLTLSVPQFEFAGLIHPDDNEGEFYRVPYSRKDEFLANLLEKASYQTLLHQTAGGSVRFLTDADSIIIKTKHEHSSASGKHTSVMGAAGLEVYVGSGNDRIYCADRGQAIAGTGASITEEVKLPAGYKEVLVTLPNYSGLSELYIGLPEGAKIASPIERTNGTILVYGTSITQGACASRSSLGFPNLTARLLDANLVHLGFSGSGRGEQIMADYIASMAKDLSAFIMNYDANSGVDEMRERCYPFYKTVRDANPDLPIFLTTCPYFNDIRAGFRDECYKIMKDTYDRAVAEGDKNVYFIDCRDNFPEELHVLRDIGVVDYCHLTDTGMYYTAKAIYEAVSKVLGK